MIQTDVSETDGYPRRRIQTDVPDVPETEDPDG